MTISFFFFFFFFFIHSHSPTSSSIQNRPGTTPYLLYILYTGAVETWKANYPADPSMTTSSPSLPNLLGQSQTRDGMTYETCQTGHDSFRSITFSPAQQNLGSYPDSWGVAQVTMLPKPNSDGKDITKTRPIAVGNCDGKIFNTIMQEAMANHTLSNFSFQKGFRRGVPGCVEHATITGEALKDAKANRKNLTIVWIDLADAFGSVKHGLIFFTMKYFGINQKVLEYFKYYYSTLRVQVRVKDQMTEAIRFFFFLFIGVKITFRRQHINKSSKQS